MSDQDEEVEEEVADGDAEEDQEVKRILDFLYMQISNHALNLLLPEQAPDNPLTSEVAGERLSLLCKTGNGLAHAFVRLDIRNK